MLSGFGTLQQRRSLGDDAFAQNSARQFELCIGFVFHHIAAHVHLRFCSRVAACSNKSALKLINQQINLYFTFKPLRLEYQHARALKSVVNINESKTNLKNYSTFFAKIAQFLAAALLMTKHVASWRLSTLSERNNVCQTRYICATFANSKLVLVHVSSDVFAKKHV